MKLLHEMVTGARHLLFPRLCCGCQRPMLAQENLVCFICSRQLSRTGNRYHAAPMNETFLRLTGRFPLERATSFCYFQKDGLIQHLLHVIKYGNRTDLAVELGEWFGSELKTAGFLEGIEGLVPVPLHYRKELKRGYNQSERIAHGISNSSNIPVLNVVKRTRHTQSQTTKTVAERVSNVADAFEARQRGRFSGKHFLLIDDVLTTGATMESCAEALLKGLPGSRLSIATAALATY